MRIDRAREPVEEPDKPREAEATTETPWSSRADADRQADFEAHAQAVRDDRTKNPRKVFAVPSSGEGQTEPADRGRAEPETEADAPTGTDKPERGWHTIEQETGELKSWSSYKSAKNELSTVAGTEIHHIVEQSQGEPKRAQFDVARINTSDNMTRIPKDVHTSISAFYSSRPPGFEVKVRDWLGGKDWDFQYDYGCRVIDNETRRHDDSDND